MLRLRLLVVVGLVALGCNYCPVGCRRDVPIRNVEGPLEDIPLTRLGLCEFRVDGPIPTGPGYVGVWVDGFPIPYDFFRIDAGVLRTQGGEDFCSVDAGRPKTVRLTFLPLVRVGGPDDEY